MTVRAKFRVHNVQPDHQGKVTSFTMHPVYGDTVENKQFFSATPGGEIRMFVVNPEVAAQFQIGSEFYVDFTPAG